MRGLTGKSGRFRCEPPFPLPHTRFTENGDRSFGVPIGFTPPLLLFQSSFAELQGRVGRSAEAVLNSNRGRACCRSPQRRRPRMLRPKMRPFWWRFCRSLRSLRNGAHSQAREGGKMGGGKVEPPYYDGSTAAAHLFSFRPPTPCTIPQGTECRSGISSFSMLKEE